METVTFHVTGMACGGCSNTLQQALLALEGVAAADVSHVEARAVVTFDPARVTVPQLRQAIVAAGYQVAA